MSFTRFHYDKCRAEKQQQEMTGPGIYRLRVPGHNETPYFINDPFIRMQKWGGNQIKNAVDLERKLVGGKVDTQREESVQEKYQDIEVFTEQTRSSNPPWNIKDLETKKMEPLHCNENRIASFEHNISTRENKNKYHK